MPPLQSESVKRTKDSLGDCMSHLALECLDIPQKELENVARVKDVWNTPLSLLHLDPILDRWNVMDEWMVGYLLLCKLHFISQP